MNYTLFLTFLIVIFLISIDRNLEEYLILLLKIAKIKIQSIWWTIRLHPQNPITNLTMRFKYDRIAKQMKKEFNGSLHNPN